MARYKLEGTLLGPIRLCFTSDSKNIFVLKGFTQMSHAPFPRVCSYHFNALAKLWDGKLWDGKVRFAVAVLEFRGKPLKNGVLSFVEKSPFDLLLL